MKGWGKTDNRFKHADQLRKTVWGKNGGGTTGKRINERY